MKNFEPDVSEDNEPKNVNLEWAMLKELAQSGDISLKDGTELDASMRERYLQYGRKVIDLINSLPDRPSDDVKVEGINEIYQMADGGGVKAGLEQAVNSKLQHLSLEHVGRVTFGREVNLTSEEEQKVEALRERVIDMNESAPGVLAGEFPSGNYLYHGSTINHLEKILQTGGLKNGVALREDDPEISAFDLNSGFEGLSWSMNQIDALPGSRGHLAGFVAAPEDLLGGGTILVIPSRPAPFEVLQVGDRINPQEFYAVKNQLETWGGGGASLGEKNNVDSNLMRMLMYKEGNMILGHSKLCEYDNSLSAEELRKYYTLDEAGNLTWDEDLYQKSEVAPAIPWIQSLIDRDIFARNGYAELDSVEKVLDYAKSNRDFVKILLATEREIAESIEERYDQMLDNATAVRVPVEKMYFVTSHQDLDDWLKVIARTGAEPKGILLYDDDQVVLENFAGQYDGNHQELSREIGRVVDVNESFWKNEMGFDPSELPRSGHKGQVLLESAVKRDKLICLNAEGWMEVVSSDSVS